MALWSQVENGQIVNTSASALSASTEKTNNNLDKEDFLNLLVAQMKYQDPLEPQSNTEYVAQLATFTQVEATENLTHTAESIQADGLVGKTVIMRTTNSVTGQTSDVMGVVDYVVKEGSKVYLSIDEALYNLDDLYTIADGEYLDAVVIANDFETAVSQLPSADSVSLMYEEAFAEIRKQYDELTAYQKEYISQHCSTSLNKFLEAETALNALISIRDLLNSSGDTDSTDTDKKDDAVTDDTSKKDDVVTDTSEKDDAVTDTSKKDEAADDTSDKDDAAGSDTAAGTGTEATDATA